MAIFPSSINALPGVYGPTDYYFIRQGSRLRIGWAGGIFLDEGNWTDAAIAFRIGLQQQSRYKFEDREFLKLGHVKIDKKFEIYLDIPVEGTSFGPPKENWRYGKPVAAEDSLQNFPELKKHYDKIKNLKVFW